MEVHAIRNMLAAALLAVAWLGCGKPPTDSPALKAAADEIPTNAQVFQVKGIIKELMPERKLARITHEEIPGYMKAMTMLFEVRDVRELKGLQSNDVVEFRMVVTETEGWIDQLKKVGTATVVGTSMKDDVRAARAVDELTVGDPMPDYTLTNELGQTFRLSDFKGRALGITFIFTRCPFPNFCPRMTANLAAAEQQLSSMANGPTNWHLLSISFDTEFDTPSVLKAYAKQHRKDDSRWTFATGALLDITAIGDHFGLMFWKEEGGFNHNTRTAVLDPRGRVFKVFEGNEWEPAAFAAAMADAARQRD
jgi:protein SCO1/2